MIIFVHQIDPKVVWDLPILISVEQIAWICYQIFMAFLENINFIRDLKMGVERKLV